MDIRLDQAKHDITSLTYATTPEQIAKTKANSLAAFWEHGVAVTDTGCDILDLRPGEEDLLVRSSIVTAPPKRARTHVRAEC